MKRGGASFARVVVGALAAVASDVSMVSPDQRSTRTTVATATAATKQAAIARRPRVARTRLTRHALQGGLGVRALLDLLGKGAQAGAQFVVGLKIAGVLIAHRVAPRYWARAWRPRWRWTRAVDSEQPRKSAISGVEQPSR